MFTRIRRFRNRLKTDSYYVSQGTGLVGDISNHLRYLVEHEQVELVESQLYFLGMLKHLATLETPFSGLPGMHAIVDRLDEMIATAREEQILIEKGNRTDGEG